MSFFTSKKPGAAGSNRGEPGGRTEEHASRRVEEAERRQAQPAADERARERRQSLQERGPDHRTDEARNRRPLRRSSAAEQMWGEPRACVGAGDEPEERE